MKQRPFPIVLLSFFYFLAPFANFYLSAILLRLPAMDYASGLLAQKGWSFALLHYFSFWVAAFAIYSVKSWSYFVYLGTTTWVFFMNFMNYANYPQVFDFKLLVASYLIQIGIVGFFLLPATRMPYFNPRIRWWETKPRYLFTGLKATLKFEDKVIEGELMDLSEGGVFFKTPSLLKESESGYLSFSILGVPYTIGVKPIYSKKDVDPGYGMQFFNFSYKDQIRMKKLITALDMLEVPTRFGQRSSIFSTLFMRILLN